MQDQIQQILNRNNALYGAFQKKQTKPKNNVVSDALRIVSSPIRNYKPFSLNDVRTGINAMIGKKIY